MSPALLDTSIVIGGIDSLSEGSAEDNAISVITLGELRAGVRMAGDPTVRAARERRLKAIRDAFEPIHVEETIAERYGEVLAIARSQGRMSRATDLLIIATAAATGRVLHTGDTRQAALARSVGVPVRQASC